MPVDGRVGLDLSEHLLAGDGQRREPGVIVHVVVFDDRGLLVGDLEGHQRLRAGPQFVAVGDGEGPRFVGQVGVHRIARQFRLRSLRGLRVVGADANGIDALHERRHREDPGAFGLVGFVVRGVGKPAAVGVAELAHREPHLPQIAGALRAACGGPRGLHGREQEPDENGNDRDHDEQLHEREGRQRPGAEAAFITSAIVCHMQLFCVYSTSR